jgi:hypothetical protein
MDYSEEYCMDCTFYMTERCTKRRITYIDPDDLDWCEDWAENEIQEGRSIE